MKLFHVSFNGIDPKRETFIKRQFEHVPVLHIICCVVDCMTLI